MNDFLFQIQCDELPYQPTAEDLAEHYRWLEKFFELDDEQGCEVGPDFHPIDCDDCPF